MRIGGILALALSVYGCAPPLTQTAPHPDRPAIVSARLEMDRIRSGCPVRFRISFRDAEENIVRALASWSYEGLSEGAGARPVRVTQDGLAAVALDPSTWMGKRDGEAEIVLTPLQPGHYYYSIQIEDAAGHRSNVVGQSFMVLSQPPGALGSCSEPVG